jgi:hypothetical protein
MSGFGMLLRVSKLVQNGVMLAALALVLPACSSGSILDDVFNKDAKFENGKALSPDLGKSDDQQVAGLYNEGLNRLSDFIRIQNGPPKHC